MRHFYSYGPVDCEQHFCVQRNRLIEQCLNYLIGVPDKGGHYFTIWAPRQTGKTWLMEEVKKEIEARYGEMFKVGKMSMQGIIFERDDPANKMLSKIPYLVRETFGMDVEAFQYWEEWSMFFSKTSGAFERPLILLIDAIFSY